ncbi:MAG: MurR/RpiR family transcriptional regulator [Coprobacillaceae bacterium]
MIFEQKVKQAKLTIAEETIANFIIENRYHLKELSTRDIARETYTSSSSVVRLSQKLNYKGFDELKEDYIKETTYLDSHFKKIDANTPFNEKHTIMQISNIMTSLMKETGDDTLSLIHHDTLQETINIIKNANVIHMICNENNLYQAHNFKYKMLRIGFHVHLEEFYGNQVYDTFLATPKDCAIVISYSGESQKVLEPIKQLKKSKIPIIAITSIGENSLKKLSTQVLEISTREKIHSKIAGFTSEYSINLILNILYACVFSKYYEKNYLKIFDRNKKIEVNRKSFSDLLKED